MFQTHRLQDGPAAGHADRAGQPGHLLPGGLDLLCQDALQGLRAAPLPCPVHLLHQLHPLLHHVRAHHL